jgi:hypothetical protein
MRRILIVENALSLITLERILRRSRQKAVPDPYERRHAGTAGPTALSCGKPRHDRRTITTGASFR